MSPTGRATARLLPKPATRSVTRFASRKERRSTRRRRRGSRGSLTLSHRCASQPWRRSIAGSAGRVTTRPRSWAWPAPRQRPPSRGAGHARGSVSRAGSMPSTYACWSARRGGSASASCRWSGPTTTKRAGGSSTEAGARCGWPTVASSFWRGGRCSGCVGSATPGGAPGVSGCEAWFICTAIPEFAGCCVDEWHLGCAAVFDSFSGGTCRSAP